MLEVLVFYGLLRLLIHLLKPHGIVLLEPRISGVKADRVISKIGFEFSHRIEAEGFSRGIWIL